jgi:hypothetical protein
MYDLGMDRMAIGKGGKSDKKAIKQGRRRL